MSNAYENCISCNNPYMGLTGYDLIGSYGNYGGYTPDFDIDPSMTMNGGLLNLGGYPTMDCGCDSLSLNNGSFTYPMFDWGANMEQYYDHMYNIREKNSERELAHQEKMQLRYRQANANVKVGEDAVKGKVAILQSTIAKNDQEHIKEAFDNLVEVQKMYHPNSANMSEAELKTEALAAYAEITGTPLVDDIRSKGKSVFTQNFLSGLTLNLFSRSDKEKTIESITGQPMSNDDKVHGILGKSFGTATLGAGIGLGGKALLKTVGLASKGSKGGTWGAIAGAVIGLGVGIYNSIKTKDTARA